MAATKPPNLIDALQDARIYPHPVSGFSVLETHMSWVLLTGSYAYKIKKPVQFAFADFSTLENRRRYCDQELRLNRRLAPGLYDSVVTVTREGDDLTLDGNGEVVEYAVRIREFRQTDLLGHLATSGQLQNHQIEELAAVVASFHQRLHGASSNTPWGNPRQVREWTNRCFEYCEPRLAGTAERRELAAIKDWTEREGCRLADHMSRRKRDGWIRECHGDLHLGNIALVDGAVVPFDCIEFNEELRWIDVVSEVAFATMDLHDRGLPRFARHLCNLYFQHTGDYEGAALLPYYKVYRALVRAEVALLRLDQEGIGETERTRIMDDALTYLRLAKAFIKPARPVLAITHGPSGSGKSYVASHLAAEAYALQIRSDIERKRLFGLSPTADTKSGIDAGIYAPETTDRTYRRLSDLAETVLSGGCSVIADATYSSRSHREAMRQRAQDLDVAFVILDCRAPRTVLEQRIRHRELLGDDASEADVGVLDRQLQALEPLSDEERAHAVIIEAGEGLEFAQLARRVSLTSQA